MEIIQLDIGGMTCAACVSHVEKGILKVPGIKGAAVNLASEKATVRFKAGEVEVEQIVQAVSDAGYSAKVTVDNDRAKAKEQKKRELKFLRLQVLLAGALSLPLLTAMFAALFKIEALMFLHEPWLQLALATPVQFFMGWRFYRGAYKSLRAGSPGMDVLVAMGTSAAYFYSIFNGFMAHRIGLHSPGLYFEASAIIITLVILGKYLELRARGKTSEAIEKLMGLIPETALVEREGQWVELPVDQIIPGDHLQVRPGERVPVDGEITWGNSALDESMITGESMPVEKGPGARVIGGTINSYGSLRFTAGHVGKDSVLSRIIAVVEEAQGSKAPIQKLADKVAAVFVPVVLVIAALTFLVWWLFLGDLNQAFLSSVAVLVIACPCALGLATPAAIMVGTGVGAQRGILIKNGEVLQLAEKLDTVVLDKTGTLTKGKPEVQDIVSLSSSMDQGEILTLAASLEHLSEHPLARAIADKGERAGIEFLEVENFQGIPGKGVSGRMKGMQYHVGTQEFLESQGLNLQGLSQQKASLEERGNTVVILADQDNPLALIALADGMKDTSPQGVRALKNLGLDVYMITGDNQRTAQAVAAKGGIHHVMAQVLPQGKAEKVMELQKQGRIVAMVGDGVNDAPALASANTGIAMGQGSDIAMESAHITLMRGDLREIAAAILLSRKTMGKIRQNLFWAFFYNILGIPLAAMGMLNPIIAGAAMAFSSVSVLSNSLLLKRFRVNGDRKDGNENQRESELHNEGPADMESISHGSDDSRKNRTNYQEEIMKSVINVEGMSCNHCKMAVEKAALALDVVEQAEVNLEKKELSLVFAHGKEDLEAVKSAVKEAGYDPQ